MIRSPIADQIWNQKYRLTTHEGEHMDDDINDTFERVAGALSVNEKDEGWTDKFYYLMNDFRFIPGGRILAGAGTGRDVTLQNCYVSPVIEDSMSGIFAAVQSAALTLQSGGGIGMDFSTIRPKGAKVVGVDSDASGPLSFMSVWDSMCKTVMSAGGRRGAMMAVLRCDHPDVMDFIAAKGDPSALRNFNMSVAVTDELMDAVADDATFDLVFAGKHYDTVLATDLWDAIMRSTYAHAEPGVMFIDRINERNNLVYCEELAATNPCGEVPLPAHGACLLGSMNLTQYVVGPFGPFPEFDRTKFRADVAVAIRMMDNVVDVSSYPHIEQRDTAQDKRRLGLGMTGLASALTMMGERYDTASGRETAARWAFELKVAAYWASMELAQERGAFPAFDKEGFLASWNVKSLPLALQQSIAEYGIRNGHLTSIAPTGTISLFADNVSSGVEPIFATEYTRKVLEHDGSKRDEVVSDYAVRRYRNGHDISLPATFVTAQDITPEAHVLMQAAVQHHVDTAISKTVNLPEDISFEDFKQVYRLAYDSGCKGCTTYRPNAVTGSVLSVEPTPAADVPVAATSDPAGRPDVLTGTTTKVRWPGSPHAYYVTVNVDQSGRPFELFVASKNVEGADLMVGMTRMVSAVMRRAGDLSFVVEELKAVADPKGGQWYNGRLVPSLLHVIGSIIEPHVTDVPASAAVTTGATCSACGEASVVHKDGCATCMSCGHSACG